MGHRSLLRISLNNHGRVWLKRFFRMRANFKPFVRNYPYDKQQPTFVVASADNDEDIMELVHSFSTSCLLTISFSKLTVSKIFSLNVSAD